MRLHRKLTLGIAATALVLGGTVATTSAFADNSDGPYTATITKNGACFRYDPYGDARADYCKDKGETEVLTCQLTNKHGNVWFKTDSKLGAGMRLNVYSGYFSSAYKNFLPKCT